MSEPTVTHNPGDVDGRTFLAHNGLGSVWRLTPDEARDLYAQLGLALAAAHAQEIRRRDRHAYLPGEWAADQEQRHADREPF